MGGELGFVFKKGFSGSWDHLTALIVYRGKDDAFFIRERHLPKLSFLVQY